MKRSPFWSSSSFSPTGIEAGEDELEGAVKALKEAKKALEVALTRRQARRLTNRAREVALEDPLKE